MKIRTGFVSNSSSSSFLIYGAAIDNSEREKLDLLIEDGFEDIEDIENLINDKDFEAHTIGYDDNYYIGVPPDRQPDDMTHGDWKKMIQSKITDALKGVECHFGWFEDCSYDG